MTKDMDTRTRRTPQRRWLRVALYALACVGCAAWVPRWWCARGADPFYEGELAVQQQLADEVAQWLGRGVDESSFHTGDPLFDGEWALVTYQMAALGLGQIALQHPEKKAAYLPLVEKSIERLLDPSLRRFGTNKWGEDGLVETNSDHGHAYLGYLNLALGMLRRLDPDTPHAAVHDRLTASLARRLAASPHGLIETYPGEAYPADVAAVVGSIGLHGQATGANDDPLLSRWKRLCEQRLIDPSSGLLFQSMDARTGKPTGSARGSGTAIAVYFVSFADEALSSELFASLQRIGHASFLGFGGIREYPPNAPGGFGDIDSGPVIFGVSVSASGFAIAGARLHEDPILYRQLYRTATLFGAPLHRSERRGYVTGGALGNAILLAMLTAPRSSSGGAS